MMVVMVVVMVEEVKEVAEPPGGQHGLELLQPQPLFVRPQLLLHLQDVVIRGVPSHRPGGEEEYGRREEEGEGRRRRKRFAPSPWQEG